MSTRLNTLLAVLATTIFSAPAAAIECITDSPSGAIPAAQLVVLDADATVTSTFCGGSAGYTSDVYLEDGVIDIYLGTGNMGMEGTEYDIGAFTAGEELIFYIYVHNTGYTYYTGPGSRNPDGIVHAAVAEVSEGVFHIGFEDLLGGGDLDYDDINLVIETTGIVVTDDDLDDDGILDVVDNCATVYNPDQADSDGDGFGDDCDVCPFDAEDDDDDDGVCGDEDACADTVLPDGVPTAHLGINRWADVDGDGEFDTVMPKGKGPVRSYTIQDTAGCSCEQIIDELMLGEGHTKFGCSISAMDEWTLLMSDD